MYYRQHTRLIPATGDLKVQELRVRTIATGLEDAACGSGSCALAAFLALQDGQPKGVYRFNLSQGSEVGRDSSLILEVRLNQQGTGVSTVILAGPATHVSEGQISLPD